VERVNGSLFVDTQTCIRTNSVTANFYSHINDEQQLYEYQNSIPVYYNRRQNSTDEYVLLKIQLYRLISYLT
jgi:hypothetical protein